MSTSALYYPNVTVVAPRRAGESQDYDRTDLHLLITAMLLWDDLQVIVPYEDFPVFPIIGGDQGDHAKSIHEAFEMIVRPRWLNDAEKTTLYKRLKKLVRAGVPPTLRFEPRVDTYKMFPEKLSPEIWDLLVAAGLASDGRHGYYGLQRDFGLIVMGLIAEICSGGTRAKVTNYRDAHEAYTRLVAVQLEEEIFRPNSDIVHSTLISISCKAINVREFSLKRLVALRQREEKDGFLPILRRNYRVALESYVDRLKTDARSPSDVKQIEVDFEREIRDDLHNLGKMLQLEQGIPLLAASFAVLLALVNPTAGLIGAIGATAIGIPTFQLAQQRTLEKHFSSWLYRAETNQPTS